MIDFNKIVQLINIVETKNSTCFEGIQMLKKNLLSSQKVQPYELPSNIVTMNSVVKLEWINSRLIFSIKLVYPSLENVREHKISIFSSLGVAIFLRKIGDELAYKTWKRDNQIKILDIPFQPEANGNYMKRILY